MIINILIGFILIGITVTIQGYGSFFWLNHIKKNYLELNDITFVKKSTRLLILTSFYLVLIHFSQAGVWAFAYYVFPIFTEFETFETAMYFSLITFTTLGYGDITLSANHRIFSGFEAVNGILLIGWSTAFMFSVVQFIWKREFKIHEEKNKTDG